MPLNALEPLGPEHVLVHFVPHKSIWSPNHWYLPPYRPYRYLIVAPLAGSDRAHHWPNQ
jgi:hypothetical protein